MQTYKLVIDAEFEAVGFADACAKLTAHFRRVSEGNAEMKDLFAPGVSAATLSITPAKGALPPTKTSTSESLGISVVERKPQNKTKSTEKL